MSDSASHDTTYDSGADPAASAGRGGPAETTTTPLSRGQAEVVGAILLFGLVIALVVLIQAVAVPSWNQQLEYEHSLRVQEDFSELKSAVDETVAAGGDRTVVVETGVHYPPRPFLFNPPPAIGALETPGRASMTVSNTTLVGVDNYWNETERFSTTSIRYRPGYHQYANGPTVVYENGYTYKSFDGGVVRPISATNLVDGNELNLVVLDGRISETQGRSAAVELNPTSAPTQSVAMHARNGTPPVIRLPTLADEAAWREALHDEIDESGSAPNRYISELRVESGSPYNTLVIRLEPGASGTQRYSLRMAEIGVGRTATATDPAYVTPESDASPFTTAGSLEPLSVQVRDEYNNPKSNVTVTFEVVDGDGTVTPATVTTGEDGVATTTFASNVTGAATVQARIDVDGADPPLERERTNFTVSVLSGSTGGGTGEIPDGVSSLNPGQNSEYPELTTVSSKQSSATLTFDNEGSRNFTMRAIRIPFYSGTDSSPTETGPSFLYGGNETSLAIPGGFQNVSGPTFGPDGTPTESASITLENLDKSPDKDFFILNVIYEDDAGREYRVSYFVGIPMETRT